MAAPQPQPELPPVPSWRNLKIFLWGALWIVLGALGPVGYTIWSWVTDPLDPTIDWHHLLKLAGACAGPALVAYWRKHKALLSPPPTP